ncbi:hypothetical protein C8J55DRAFT_514817, partial [Lentinula edodes]
LLSLYSRSPGTNGVTAVLLITSLLSHSSSALRHLVALARLHGVHDLNTSPLLNPISAILLYSSPSRPQLHCSDSLLWHRSRLLPDDPLWPILAECISVPIV